MPFLPPGFANISFEMVHETSGQEAITSIGIEVEAADPVVTMVTCRDAFETNLSPIIGDSWTGTDVKMTLGTSNPAAPLVFSSGAWEGGSNTGESCPPNVSTVLVKVTNLGGRKGRGRMFLPSPAEGGVDNAGLFSDSQHSDNILRAQSFVLELRELSTTVDVVLLHTSPADTPTSITDMGASRYIGQQKRRLRG